MSVEQTCYLVQHAGLRLGHPVRLAYITWRPIIIAQLVRRLAWLTLACIPGRLLQVQGYAVPRKSRSVPDPMKRTIHSGEFL